MASPDDDARARILQAALAVWTEGGPAQAKVTVIRERAGVSTGCLYHHFRDREDVLASLFLEGLEDYQGGLLGRLEDARDAHSGVHAIVGWHLDWVSANPTWARYLLAGAPSSSARFKAARSTANRRFFAALSAWAAPHVAEGHLRPLPLDQLSALVLGPVEAYSRQLLAGRRVSVDPSVYELFGHAAWLTVTSAEHTAPRKGTS